MAAERDLLATTWNGNQSGRLWDTLWYREDGRYYAKVCASGLFVGPNEYPDEATFWAAFEAERTEFNGARTAAGEASR